MPEPMGELDHELNKLRRAVELLRKVHSTDIGDAREDIADSVASIENVIGELGSHDCNDFADEFIECRDREIEFVKCIPHVRECLEFGLPHLIEKYGWNSNEVLTAQTVIEEQQ